MSLPTQTLRQPVVVVLGHVDSGKTSFLDKIRGTAVQAREAGGITQEIGASFFPMETLTAICGALLDKTGAQLKIPGLLVIDTPGHEVFSNLRMRGGSAADIAILLVDVQKGLENQTMESIEILKERKVPFLVALNKIDMIRGWRKDTKGALGEPSLKQQPPEWNDELEERLYNVVGGALEAGFDSDAFYRIKDFRKQVSIVPISARYGVGIPELLAVLIGLAQQFLTRSSSPSTRHGRARGIILELQEEVGMGETANIILTEGKLLGRATGSSSSRGTGPSSRGSRRSSCPSRSTRCGTPATSSPPVQEVYSAAGVKLVISRPRGRHTGHFGHDLQDGGGVRRRSRPRPEKDLTTLVTKSDIDGVVVKAGNIGGLEALLRMLGPEGDTRPDRPTSGTSRKNGDNRGRGGRRARPVSWRDNRVRRQGPPRGQGERQERADNHLRGDLRRGRGLRPVGRQEA